MPQAEYIPRDNMRNILLISYLYPPIVNPGSYHVIRYVRHLPKHGFHPLVLTSAVRGVLVDDNANDVFRSTELLAAFKRLYRAFQLRGVEHDQQAGISVTPPGGVGSWLRQIAIPDLQVTWYPLAIRRARTLFAQYPVQALYSTSGSETNHLVALQLKRETGLPWVADFRDGWLFESLNPARTTGRVRPSIESRLERAVVSNADCISVVNQGMAEDFCRRYPQAADKIAVISNGFDANDFVGLERSENRKFTLVHTGSLGLSRNGTSIEGFLNALRTLKSEQHQLIQDLEVMMVGRLSDVETAAIERSSLNDLIQLVGEVSNLDALRYQINAQVLLLITHPDQLAISTTKLFEYLGAKRPILALTPENSSAAGIVNEVQAGTVVPPNNPQAISLALKTFHALWQTSMLTPTTHMGIYRYEYQYLTEQLATLFNQAIQSR